VVPGVPLENRSKNQNTMIPLPCIRPQSPLKHPKIPNVIVQEFMKSVQVGLKRCSNVHLINSRHLYIAPLLSTVVRLSCVSDTH
jgi:hypothetical protein